LSDPGLAVPVTPPRDDVTLGSPHGSSTEPMIQEELSLKNQKGARWRKQRNRESIGFDWNMKSDSVQ
jgi:hypothetical protein